MFARDKNLTPFLQKVCSLFTWYIKHDKNAETSDAAYENAVQTYSTVLLVN